MQTRMKPQFFLLLLCRFLLVIFLLAPSIATLIDFTEEKIAFMDLSEEENNKEGEKKADDKELFFQNTLNHKCTVFAQKLNKLNHLIILYKGSYSDIFLPPPKRLGSLA